MTYDILAGTRVVESSAFIAAPLCGFKLAQLGAEVIRVDAIGGGIDYGRLPLAPGGRSLYWTSLNRSKRSVAVDLRRPEGRELVAALATAEGPKAGVLLTNIDRDWLSHERLQAQRPDVITCVIEGNPDGSSALDYTVNCATGYPALTQPEGAGTPVNHALPAWDLLCAHQAALGIVSALMQRQETGRGTRMRLALSDVAFATLSDLGLLAEVELTGHDRAPVGNHIYGAFGRDFLTADGRRIMIAAVSARQWRALVEATGLGPTLAAIEAQSGLVFAREADRFEARDVIAALVARWCAARPHAEIERVFAEAGVCRGDYRSVRELLAEDPRVSLDNPVFAQIDTPGVGRHRTAGSPLRLGDTPRRTETGASFLGADTDRVLAEVLGLSDGQIGHLHDRGIVAGPERADPHFEALRHAG